MLRPKAAVLPDAALVPSANLRPPPRRFTHEVVAEQPFQYDRDAAPVGHFAPGTRLCVLEDGPGALCLVQDRSGLCVMTPSEGLRPLPPRKVRQGHGPS